MAMEITHLQMSFAWGLPSHVWFHDWLLFVGSPQLTHGMPHRLLVLSIDFHMAPYSSYGEVSSVRLHFSPHDSLVKNPHSCWLTSNYPMTIEWHFTIFDWSIPSFRGWNPHFPSCLLAKSPRTTVKTQGFPWIFHGKVRSKPPRHRAGLALGDLERWSPERLGSSQDGDVWPKRLVNAIYS